MTVIHDGRPQSSPEVEIEIGYPTEFDLSTASDLASAIGQFQEIVAKAGALPAIEGLMLGRLLRLCMPGLTDAQYARCDAEIVEHFSARNPHFK
jgi:hypothetical protein